MIREIMQDDIKACANLILESNKGVNQTRYFPTEENEIIKRICNRIESNHHIILIDEDNERMTGYLELLMESDETYIQILAFFSNVDYQKCFNAFYEWLCLTYIGFDVDFVVNDFNTNAVNFMKSIHAKTDGLDTMLYIERSQFKKKDAPNIMLLSGEYENQFARLHDQIFLNVYWNSNRLRKENNRFKTFIAMEQEQMIGYAVLSSFGRNEEEIYFLYAKDMVTKINLIDKALTSAFTETNRVLLLVSERETSEIVVYTDYGFSVKERIYTFTIHIS